MEALPDEEYLDLAAQAYYLEERERTNWSDALLLALGRIFRR